MENKIKEFVVRARANNATDEEIVKTLLEQGWKLDQIQPHLHSSSSLNGIIPPKPSSVVSSELGMWDSFQHILMFISLYIMATTITIFLNYYIDYWHLGMPSIGSYGNAQDAANRALISGLSASLIVSYPFFSYFFISINKRKMEVPEIVKLELRKVFIYFTLIITFIITLCHLIFLVFQILNGFILFNSVLHFFVTLSVSGSIFSYFLNEVRHDRIVKNYHE